MYIHIFPMGQNKRSGYNNFFCETKFFTISKQNVNSEFFFIKKNWLHCTTYILFLNTFLSHKKIQQRKEKICSQQAVACSRQISDSDIF